MSMGKDEGCHGQGYALRSAQVRELPGNENVLPDGLV